jgi:hypothetical protein
MNIESIYNSGLSFIVATAILAILGLLLIGGVAGLLITLKRERAYSRTALPSLDSEETKPEVVVPDDDMQYLPVSAFDVGEEEHLLEDQDANKLMADIDKAKSAQAKSGGSHAAPRNKTRSKLTNVFKK